METRGSPSQSSQQEPEVGWTKIKKETTDNEIKEFAETAMNEMLGWYGYDKIADNGTSRRTSSRTSSSTARSLRKHSSDVHTTDSDSTDEEEPKFRRSRTEATNSSEGELQVPKADNTCGWCNKPLAPSSCGSFCSELCFSQSRRASFKKNKTCDWCRHIRHTVSYVDFQDGASQLQFCSDKCLNQYKMHIFCREAQAHLELLPAQSQNSQSALITPELWLRNCQSPPPVEVPSKPLITVAPPNKLMPKKKLRPKDLRKPPPPNLFFRPPPPFHPPPFYLPPPPPPSLLPPTTILVPYPIILPIPLPIPIPVPLNEFLKAAAAAKEKEEDEEEIIVEDDVKEPNSRKRKKGDDDKDVKIKFVSV